MTTKEKDKLQLNVIAGAALLDRYVPDWYKAVNLEDLYMGDGTRCIIGQICRKSDIVPYNNFCQAVHWLGIGPGINIHRNYSVNPGYPLEYMELGFDIDMTVEDSSGVQYQELAMMWSKRINKRRELDPDTEPVKPSVGYVS